MRRGLPNAHIRSGLAVLLVVIASCSRVPPHLELPHLETKQPAFAATLGGYSGTPVVGGNRVDILLNGEEIFPAKLAAIRSARRSINYAQYVFENGKPAEEIAAALAERCRAGVQVNVLLDAVGALAMPAELRTEMTDAGCRVESFRPLGPFTFDRFNNRNHRRILVVDGVVGVTGGSGISGKWSGNGKQSGHWRDTDVRIEGPVVEQLQGAFAENWLETTGVAIGGPEYFPRRRLTAKGDVDAAAVSPATVGYFNLLHREAPLVMLHSYDAEPELSWNLTVGLRRSDSALRQAVDRAIERLMSDGTVSTIYSHYGIAHRPPTTP